MRRKLYQNESGMRPYQIKIPESIMEELTSEAAENLRDRNDMIRVILGEHVQRRRRKKGRSADGRS